MIVHDYETVVVGAPARRAVQRRSTDVTWTVTVRVDDRVTVLHFPDRDTAIDFTQQPVHRIVDALDEEN